MPQAPNLLNDDGSASMATAIMMSHHGFRRDIARFARALASLASGGDRAPTTALREEWQSYRATLHGHHLAEDGGLFPNIKSQQASLGPTIDRLAADHRLIDPLLERGDRAFAELPRTEAAAAVIAELAALLEPHLATEEAEVIPFIRAAKSFPPPGTDAEAEMYAQGFAWASQGIAPDVLDKVYATLPESVRGRLPAARAAFDARCERVWGFAAAGASRTPIPDSP
jgi:hemerythrin-like domain-containing protein